MGESKQNILEKRKRWQAQKEKNEAKLRALQDKVKKDAIRIAEAEKKEEAERRMILGSYFLEKSKTDPSFKTWLEGEIASSPLGSYEKRLFGLQE